MMVMMAALADSVAEGGFSSFLYVKREAFVLASSQ